MYQTHVGPALRRSIEKLFNYSFKATVATVQIAWVILTVILGVVVVIGTIGWLVFGIRHL